MRVVQSEPLLENEGGMTPSGEFAESGVRFPRQRRSSFAVLSEKTAALRRRAASAMPTKADIALLKENAKKHGNTMMKYGIFGGIMMGLTVAITTFMAVPEATSLLCGEVQENAQSIKHFSENTGSLVATNLGGWLCLEDWFHSGSVGRYVSTPDTLPRGQGACLPPVVTGPLDEPWPSEGHLAHRLNASHGPEYAVHAFTQFREHFVTEDDFRAIAALGIKTIRIPVNWAFFADALKDLDPEVYGSHDPDTEPVLVPDPFYSTNISMVTVRRKWFRELMGKAADHGLRIILDMHAMPGGSSDGTYSGIWPLEPVFWHANATIGGGVTPLLQIGTWITMAMIAWVESLTELLQRGAIWGVCFMNEPAHLSGINAKWGRFATSDQVLEFVETYSGLFRASALPVQGVRLYVQLIETAWASGDVFEAEVPAWYHRTFTRDERYSWAVIARHFYTAWGCNGEIVQGAMYQCDEMVDQIKGRLNACIVTYAEHFAQIFQGLRAITEWSLGTSPDANLACTSQDVLRALFEENVQAFANIEPGQQIEPVFWSWKMPYGPKFQPGWSLKYFAGLDEASDSDGRCMVGAWAQETPV